MARLCNYFAVETQQCIVFVCFVDELQVIVKYVTIFTVAQQRFVVNLCYRQQCQLYVPVSF